MIEAVRRWGEGAWIHSGGYPWRRSVGRTETRPRLKRVVMGTGLTWEEAFRAAGEVEIAARIRDRFRPG